MLKKILSICFSLQLCMLLNAQDSKMSISLSPAVVQMPEWSVAIQPGIQHRINSRIAIIGEFCIPMVNISRDSHVSDQTYFRFKGELKYYLHSTPRTPYISIESSYAYRQFNVQNSTFHKGNYYDTVVYGFQYASVRSPIWITNLKIGREYKLGPRMGLDIFAGMGFRNISTHYSDVKGLTQEPYARPYCRIFPTSDPAWWFEANVFRFNATFGFRFLYQF